MLFPVFFICKMRHVCGQSASASLCVCSAVPRLRVRETVLPFWQLPFWRISTPLLIHMFPEVGQKKIIFVLRHRAHRLGDGIRFVVCVFVFVVVLMFC